jgi:two-component system sensor histidine kinase RegB
MPTHYSSSPVTSRILSQWYMRLRWFAFAGQALVLLIALLFFELTLPWLLLGTLLLCIPLTNFAARSDWLSFLSERQLVGFLLASDTLLLSSLLALAGGASNPFTIVFLLHVVLAAVMLDSLWTWIIAGLSSLGFASLFLFARSIPEWEHHSGHHGFSLHLHGMLLAYVTVAFLVAYFLNKIVGELRRKERRLQRLEHLARSQQRLASLTTITAGAAHELGTPLATIALVAHELERTLQPRMPDSEVLEDLQLLKQETARCKQILSQLAERTGDLLGESPATVSVQALLDLALEPLRGPLQEKQVVLSLAGCLELLLPRVPVRALSLALRALIKNALESSQTAATIELRVALVGDMVEVRIQDSGMGMDQDTLDSLGEPFFSTKGAGKGMGLGVYLARLCSEQLGGSLTYTSRANVGTCAVFRFQADCRQEA